MLALAQIILRALYLLYTAAPRNLSEFERVINDFLISCPYQQNKSVYERLNVFLALRPYPCTCALYASCKTTKLHIVAHVSSV